MKTLKFIDLFAGLGGFHLAINKLAQEQGFEAKCVYSSELRADLRVLYSSNFGIPYNEINADITQLTSDEIILREVPAHDLLCAGFPCQPFSKAGKRQGFSDEAGRGVLFNYIEAILRLRRPKYIILENVANLENHDGGNTWCVIKEKLEALNYDVKEKILSPNEFGIPQHRKRIYIVGIHRYHYKSRNLSLNKFRFPDPTNTDCHISTILEPLPLDFIPLKEETRIQLDVWQSFVNLCVRNTGDVPITPIWAMEFGATYDFEHLAPAYQSVSNLHGKCGDRGKIITGTTMEECLKQLPVYARTSKDKEFPKWKKNFIRKNRLFYINNKYWIDQWITSINGWKNSHIKLEWNCTLEDGIFIQDKIVQYRPSGIRVKRPTCSPALTYMGSQTPIFPWANGGRYITVKEAARLQGMDDIKFGLLNHSRIFEALGNAVNVDVVKSVLFNLLKI